MTVYRAPTADMTFLLNHVLAINEIAALPGFEDATPDMVDAILTEAARFFGEVVAPTNQARWHDGPHCTGTGRHLSADAGSRVDGFGRRCRFWWSGYAWRAVHRR